MTETDSHGENGSSCDRFGEVKLIFCEIKFGDMLIFFCAGRLLLVSHRYRNLIRLKIKKEDSC